MGAVHRSKATCHEHLTLCLFCNSLVWSSRFRPVQQIDATAFAKLLVDWTSLYTFMQKEGGDKVLRTWADCTCPFDLLHIQEKWADKAFCSDRATWKPTSPAVLESLQP